MENSRIIKFRGISRENNRFEYGMLMYSCSDSGLVIVETVNAPPSMQDPCGDTINLYHGIKPGTEGQYTGLKDKNGNEIYSGDVIRHQRWHKGSGQYVYSDHEVYFDNELCSFELRRSNELFHNQFNNEFEIIGNVHQDKHLLK